jgi:hypothetical protein
MTSYQEDEDREEAVDLQSSDEEEVTRHQE